jgi:aminoglycoside phosphotransferase (APT) family kinase protein
MSGEIIDPVSPGAAVPARGNRADVRQDGSVPDSWLHIARDLAASHLGPVASGHVEALAVGAAHGVFRVRADDARWVLKVAGLDARPALDYTRTATAQTRAGAAGVPVAPVAAAGVHGTTQFLLQEEVEGVEWRTARARLGAAELAAASTQIARAVLRLQSVTAPSFGALDEVDAGRRLGLLDAMRDRIRLRIPAGDRRAVAERVLQRHSALFDEPQRPVLTHDDLHHANLLFRPTSAGWRLAAVLDWDKAWLGPPESDVARMAFWDDMADDVFWSTYHRAQPPADGWPERALVHQLLWCLEYDVATPRHQRDTAALVARLA